eukprot:8305949-Pyramimonas_sp.AAC.1
MAAHIVRAEYWALSEHVLDKEDSPLVLTDYSAASPSIWIDRLLGALEVMGAPRLYCAVLSYVLSG